MKKEPVTPQSLDDIRLAIREIDIKRRDNDLSDKEREILEKSAVVLRDAERIAIAAIQDEVIDDIVSSVEQVKKQSRTIRAKVTQMNKVPKTLDHIEQVMAVVVETMKAISKWAFLLVLLLFCATSCAVLTTSQVKMVSSLAIASDSVSKNPSVIFDKMSEVRKTRGLLYAASLSTPEAHCSEMELLSNQLQKESKQADKASAYVKALNAYCKALQSLSNASRWKQYGTELRGIGRKSDSVIVYLNRSKLLSDNITVGLGKLTGQYTALLTENYMKCRQAKALKAFVTESDPLVQSCVDSLVAVLKSPALKTLLDYEHKALKDDYRAFIDAAGRTDQYTPVAMIGDVLYLSTEELLTNIDTHKSQCTAALRTFAKAHKKLASNLQKRSDTSKSELAEDIYDDILELNMLAASMVKLTNK